MELPKGDEKQHRKLAVLASVREAWQQAWQVAMADALRRLDEIDNSVLDKEAEDEE